MLSLSRSRATVTSKPNISASKVIPFRSIAQTHRYTTDQLLDQLVQWPLTGGLLRLIQPGRYWTHCTTNVHGQLQDQCTYHYYCYTPLVLYMAYFSNITQPTVGLQVSYMTTAQRCNNVICDHTNHPSKLPPRLPFLRPSPNQLIRDSELKRIVFDHYGETYGAACMTGTATICC